MIVASCSIKVPPNGVEEVAYKPLDCPWLYERKTVEADVQIRKDDPIVVSELELGV